MVFLPALIIGLFIQLLIGSLIGAVILRAACALFNKLFGKEFLSSVDQPEPVVKPPVNVPESRSLESQSPYAPPLAPLMQSSSGGVYARGVPAPNYGRAFLICLLALITNTVPAFALGLVVRAQDLNVERIVPIILVVVGFIVLATANTLGLPTSFPRALGVTGLFFLITIAVVVSIGVVIGLAISFAG